jgi:hypothetical protein
MIAAAIIRSSSSIRSSNANNAEYQRSGKTRSCNRKFQNGKKAIANNNHRGADVLSAR